MKEISELLNVTLNNMMNNSSVTKQEVIPWLMGDIPWLNSLGINLQISNVLLTHLVKYCGWKKKTLFKIDSNIMLNNKKILEIITELQKLDFFVLLQDNKDNWVLVNNDGYINIENDFNVYHVRLGLLSLDTLNKVKELLDL